MNTYQINQLHASPKMTKKALLLISILAVAAVISGAAGVFTQGDAHENSVLASLHFKQIHG